MSEALAQFDPKDYVANLPRMWQQNWTDGEVVASMPAKNQVKLMLQNWKGHHPFGCELVYHGAIVIFEKMGYSARGEYLCKDATGDSVCIGKLDIKGSGSR